MVLTRGDPTGRVIPRRSRIGFSGDSPGPHQHDPAIYNPRNPISTGRNRSEVQPKRLERKRRRSHLLVCRWIYEVSCSSTCTLGFTIHVETMSPPSLNPSIAQMRKTGSFRGTNRPKTAYKHASQQCRLLYMTRTRTADTLSGPPSSLMTKANQ